MDNAAELTEQIRQIMAITFRLDENELPDDVSQDTCTRWTSLRHMTLLMALEEHFGITFLMNEITFMTSLPKIVAVVKQYTVQAGV